MGPQTVKREGEPSHKYDRLAHRMLIECVSSSTLARLAVPPAFQGPAPQAGADVGRVVVGFPSHGEM